MSRAKALGLRLLAYAADCLLLFALLAVSQCALIVAGLHPFVARFGAAPVIPSQPLLHLWVFASATLPFAAYFAAFFASARGATLGQRLAGLKVGDAAGGRLPAGKALWRAAVLLVPFELNHVVLFHAASWAGGSETLHVAGSGAVGLLCLLYLALPLLRADRRSVHDLAAGSIVVPARASAISS